VCWESPKGRAGAIHGQGGSRDSLNCIGSSWSGILHTASSCWPQCQWPPGFLPSPSCCPMLAGPRGYSAPNDWLLHPLSVGACLCFSACWNQSCTPQLCSCLDSETTPLPSLCPVHAACTYASLLPWWGDFCITFLPLVSEWLGHYEITICGSLSYASRWLNSLHPHQQQLGFLHMHHSPLLQVAPTSTGKMLTFQRTWPFPPTPACHQEFG
jgi:hypothetical protein